MHYVWWERTPIPYNAFKCLTVIFLLEKRVCVRLDVKCVSPLPTIKPELVITINFRVLLLELRF